jgi:23S rRNA (cytidine1920-2'-O)/16S rRNA (cytidine1409-2'-O)-methyltransferase
VIRDPAIHRQIVEQILGFAQSLEYGLHGLIRSPILGPKGNVEFLAYFRSPGVQGMTIEQLVEGCFTQAEPGNDEGGE